MLTLPIIKLCQCGRRSVAPTREFEAEATSTIERMLNCIVNGFSPSDGAVSLDKIREKVRHHVSPDIDTAVNPHLQRFYQQKASKLIVPIETVADWLADKTITISPASFGEILVYFAALIEVSVRAMTEMTIAEDLSPVIMKNSQTYVLTKQKFIAARNQDLEAAFDFA